VVAAVAAARELPRLNLLDALELTMLIVRKDSGRYARVAARWLQRLLEEHPDLTIEEAALAASCLVALPGAGYGEAAQGIPRRRERKLDDPVARSSRETLGQRVPPRPRFSRNALKRSDDDDRWSADRF
jgi:hypothetical protein